MAESVNRNPGSGIQIITEIPGCKPCFHCTAQVAELSQFWAWKCVKSKRTAMERKNAIVMEKHKINGTN